MLGGELRSIAIPTFQNILQTIAPPISSHERLQIHITHDLSGYPTLDPLIYAVFSRVMSQVEGGDLMVIQKGQEASPRRGSDVNNSSRSIGGWNDGPWWRAADKRSINAVKGVSEGSKLAKASAGSYASEYFVSRGGVEEAAKAATKTLSESNPTRNSDIFLAIQALTQMASDEAVPAKDEDGQGGMKDVDDAKDREEVVFAIYLHDPIHGIDFRTLSQSVPSQWVEWLDASGANGGEELPESIAEIIESGGVDPREWVAEWIEEALTLGVGVVAQRYVARRMGIGEGGVGKGKMKADRGASEMVESGGGEAARAIGGM
jgi:hypothetical protein